MQKTLNIIASLITIFQFIIINFLSDVKSSPPKIIGSFGFETKILLFLLVQLLIFYLLYSFTRFTMPKIRNLILLIGQYFLNLALIGYLSIINFKVFFGSITQVVKEGSASSVLGFFIIVIGFIMIITTAIAQDHGWNMFNN